MYISKKCSIAIHCLIFINEYSDTVKVTSELLASSTGCNPVTIRNLLSSLKKAGIISIPSGVGGASIEIPLEEINLYQICNAVEPNAIDKLMGIHTTSQMLCPVGRNIQTVLNNTYQPLKEDLIASLSAITMKEIVEDYRRTVDEEIN